MPTLLLAFALAFVAVAPQPRLETVYVTATTRGGALALDLGPGDFALKEGGRLREIVEAGLADERMQVALIVDDNGTGLFRSGVATFIQRLHPRADISVTRVVNQPQRLVDFTTSPEALIDAIRRLGPQPATPDGGQLLSAIYETTRVFDKREAARPIIVALTVGGEEHSPLPAHEVLDRLQQSRATLYVVSVASSALRTNVAITRPADLLDSNLNLNEVLGDGPKQSGGRREQIVATAGTVSCLERIADELLHQYAVVYALPSGVKPTGRLSLEATRRDVNLRAPTRVPKR